MLREGLRSLERRLAFSLVSALFLLVGTVLLSVALFLVLDALRGPIFAATVMGLGSVGLGLLAAVLARDRGGAVAPPAPAAAEPHASGLPSLSDAFLTGVETGHSLRRIVGRR